MTVSAILGLVAGFLADVFSDFITQWRRDNELRRQGRLQERIDAAGRDMRAVRDRPYDLDDRLSDGSF